MGNDQSQSNGHHRRHHTHQPPPPVDDSRFVKAFDYLSNGNSSIKSEYLKNKLGPLLGHSLWKYLNEGNQKEIAKNQFLNRAGTLIDVSADRVVEILMPPRNLVETCLEADGIDIKSSDEKKFVDTLVENLTASGSGTDSIIAWKNANCVRICQPAKDKIFAIFSGNQNMKSVKVDSELLNSAQMFILRKGLPTTIFYPRQSQTDLHSPAEEDWILLYYSSRDGLSINRFDTKVFDYKGPTVAIFCLTSNDIYAIVSDEEWRNCTKPFGGPYSMFYQFHPKFERFEFPPPAVYCNFRNRTSKYGISYGRISVADESMSNVQRMEVWGCAGTEVYQEQNKQKHRQKQQVERNAKVPLPGKWDESADKAILEMAGHTFSHERR